MKNILIIIIIFLTALFYSCSNNEKAKSESEIHEHSSVEEYYTCPMHPSVKSDKPGACPVCNMALVKTQVKKVSAQVEEYYTCPMHPSVKSDRPGACPVCNMALVKQTKSVSHNMDLDYDEHKNLGTVTLSPSQQVMANVSISKVENMILHKEFTTVGLIEASEPLRRVITSRIAGRVEKLHVNFTGDYVSQGQLLIEIYSPELVSAQQEYLLALGSTENNTKNVSLFNNPGMLVESAKEKLLLLGITEKQLTELEKTEKLQTTLKIYSPLSGIILDKPVYEGMYVQEGTTLYDLADLSKVWMYADVYEYELDNLKLNQEVQLTTEAYPGENFNGKITFISPVINPDTRTIKVRAEFQNLKNKLKPKMYVNANFEIVLKSSLVVPVSAVITTGLRNVVWVEIHPGVYEPRKVKLGAKAENYVQIISGLHEGDTIVTSGGYLIDSESQLIMSGTIGHEGMEH